MVCAYSLTTGIGKVGESMPMLRKPYRRDELAARVRQVLDAKRAIAEPDRTLGADELKHRICAYYECELLDPIAQQVR